MCCYGGLAKLPAMRGLPLDSARRSHSATPSIEIGTVIVGCIALTTIIGLSRYGAGFFSAQNKFLLNPEILLAEGTSEWGLQGSEFHPPVGAVLCSQKTASANVYVLRGRMRIIFARHQYEVGCVNRCNIKAVATREPFLHATNRSSRRKSLRKGVRAITTGHGNLPTPMTVDADVAVANRDDLFQKQMFLTIFQSYPHDGQIVSRVFKP